MDEQISRVIAFARENPVMAGVIGLVLLVFMVRKTKLFFGLVVLVLLLWGIWSVIMEVAGGSSGVKTRLIEKGSSSDPAQ